jgi:hypothetical protein
MSLDNQEATAPAEAINGFADLYPRQVSTQKTIVLSLRGDDPRAYEVDTVDLDCDCPDHQMNKSDPAVCDHIAVALYEGSAHLEVSEALVTDLQRVLSDIEASARKVDETAEILEDDLVELRTTEASQAADDSSGSTSRDPVDRLHDTLEAVGFDPTDVDAWVDSDMGSLQFEPDDMDQDQFDQFGDWCRETPSVNWDRDERRNYIKPSDFEEILE